MKRLFLGACLSVALVVQIAPCASAWEGRDPKIFLGRDSERSAIWMTGMVSGCVPPVGKSDPCHYEILVDYQRVDAQSNAASGRVATFNCKSKVLGDIWNADEQKRSYFNEAPKSRAMVTMMAIACAAFED
jgi:hypothetical protein